jgi:HK97 family phage prohead protease
MNTQIGLPWGLHPLEMKFGNAGSALTMTDGEIAGYASVFGVRDQSGDIVERGAYAGSIARLGTAGSRVKMLWQHNPAQPIGVWDTVVEDAHGLFVKGRLLREVQAAREALVLLEAGAIDGLSIGYRTIRAEKASGGRLLQEVELWEVSIVTFPMLPEARVAATPDEALMRDLAEAFDAARCRGD